jgi:hypothetical protein
MKAVRGGKKVHCSLVILRYNKFLCSEENEQSHNGTSNIQTAKPRSFILQLVQRTFDRPIKFSVHLGILVVYVTMK